MRILLVIGLLLLLLQASAFAFELKWTWKTYTNPSNRETYSEARGTCTVDKRPRKELCFTHSVVYDLVGATHMNNDIAHQTHAFFMVSTLLPHLNWNDPDEGAGGASGIVKNPSCCAVRKKRRLRYTGCMSNSASYSMIFTDQPGVVFAHDQNPFQTSLNLLYLMQQQMLANDIQWTAGLPVALPIVPVPLFPELRDQTPDSVKIQIKDGKVVLTVIFTRPSGSQSVYEISLLQVSGGQFQFTLVHQMHLDAAAGASSPDFTVEFTVLLDQQSLNILTGISVLLPVQEEPEDSVDLATDMVLFDAFMGNEAALQHQGELISKGDSLP